MIAAARPDRRSIRLLTLDAAGGPRHLERADLAALFEPGDLVVANDAATLPGSLTGTHVGSGAPIEVRLAAWVEAGDPTRFVALTLGEGDHRTRTEDRPAPPLLSSGDLLRLGPLVAVVERLLDHPRLFRLRFRDDETAILAGLARHGRPIQYAHVPVPVDLWAVWTHVAAAPTAFEAPSAGFALDSRTLTAWRRRGVAFATLTLAAGISSTGDPTLDRRLPFDEQYGISPSTAEQVNAARRRGGRVIAIGTTVVRALEASADADGRIVAGNGVATDRIGPATRLRVVDSILTGMHQPGESHFELLRAFTSGARLEQVHSAAVSGGYRAHEFGDVLLVERQGAGAR